MWLCSKMMILVDGPSPWLLLLPSLTALLHGLPCPGAPMSFLAQTHLYSCHIFQTPQPTHWVEGEAELVCPCGTQALTHSYFQSARIWAPLGMLLYCLQCCSGRTPTTPPSGPRCTPFPWAALPAQGPLRRTVWVRMTRAVSQPTPMWWETFQVQVWKARLFLSNNNQGPMIQTLEWHQVTPKAKRMQTQSFLLLTSEFCRFPWQQMLVWQKHDTLIFFFLWERFLSIGLNSFIGEGDKRSYWQAKKPPWFSFWWGLALQFPCPQKPVARKPHSYWE